MYILVFCLMHVGANFYCWIIDVMCSSLVDITQPFPKMMSSIFTSSYKQWMLYIRPNHWVHQSFHYTILMAARNHHILVIICISLLFNKVHVTGWRDILSSVLSSGVSVQITNIFLDWLGDTTKDMVCVFIIHIFYAICHSS